jgi:hypothetical protein
VGGTDLIVAQRADHQRARDPDPSEQEAEEVDGALVGPVQVIDDEDGRVQPEVFEHCREDLVRLARAAERRDKVVAELGRQVVDRSKRTWWRQWVARAPQDWHVIDAVLGERLQERALARPRLTAHDDHAATPTPGAALLRREGR